MILLGLFLELFAASLPLQVAGYTRCQLNECPYSGATPPTQFRNLAACLMGPDTRAGSSCECADLDSDDFVTLRDLAAFQNTPVQVCFRNLTIRQDPGLGFCPQVGAVLRANVIPALNGLPLLVGSLVELGDPDIDRCVYSGPFKSCYVGVPFLARQLTATEWFQLSALIQAIPAEGCPCLGQCNYAIDPCQILKVNNFDTYCYAYGSGTADDLYRDALWAVADYAAELATSDPP